MISTIAGSGSAGYSGDGGPATSATFNNPIAVALDSSGRVCLFQFLVKSLLYYLLQATCTSLIFITAVSGR